MTLDNLTSLKVAFIFIILTISLFGLLPIYCKKFRNHPTILSILNCFAAGVFLAMALIHILPDSVAGYYDIMRDRFNEEHGIHTIDESNRRLLMRSDHYY